MPEMGFGERGREGGDDKFISSIVHRSDGRMDGHAISSWRVGKEERERAREKGEGPWGKIFPDF